MQGKASNSGCIVFYRKYTNFQTLLVTDHPNTYQRHNNMPLFDNVWIASRTKILVTYYSSVSLLLLLFTRVTVLCSLSKTHLTPKSTGNTQEAVASSQHD